MSSVLPGRLAHQGYLAGIPYPVGGHTSKGPGQWVSALDVRVVTWLESLDAEHVKEGM
jgi:hypothetical protein